MVLIPVLCPHCRSEQVIKGGKTETGKQRYRCQQTDCSHRSFVLAPAYNGRLPHIIEQMIYVFGRRKDEVFLQLKALLEPFGITRYFTDYWGAYTRHLEAGEH
jgi:IS1 family transposase